MRISVRPAGHQLAGTSAEKLCQRRAGGRDALPSPASLVRLLGFELGVKYRWTSP